MWSSSHCFATHHVRVWVCASVAPGSERSGCRACDDGVRAQTRPPRSQKPPPVGVNVTRTGNNLEISEPTTGFKCVCCVWKMDIRAGVPQPFADRGIAPPPAWRRPSPIRPIRTHLSQPSPKTHSAEAAKDHRRGGEYKGILSTRTHVRAVHPRHCHHAALHAAGCHVERAGGAAEAAVPLLVDPIGVLQPQKVQHRGGGWRGMACQTRTRARRQRRRLFSMGWVV